MFKQLLCDEGGGAVSRTIDGLHELLQCCTDWTFLHWMGVHGL